MRLFSGEPARFRSPLSPEECIQRLSDRVASRWSVGSHTGFAGSVSADRVAIGRKYTLAHNSLQTWFVGRVERVANGSELIGAFRITRGNAVGICFVFAWFLLIGGSGTIIGTGQPRGHVLFGGFTLLLMLLLVGFYRFGRWLARNDRRVISSMLTEVLVAQEIDASPPRA